MSNGVVDGVGGSVSGSQSLVSNVEVEVFGSFTANVAARRPFCCGDDCGEYK